MYLTHSIQNTTSVFLLCMEIYMHVFWFIVKMPVVNQFSSIKLPPSPPPSPIFLFVLMHIPHLKSCDNPNFHPSKVLLFFVRTYCHLTHILHIGFPIHCILMLINTKLLHQRKSITHSNYLRPVSIFYPSLLCIFSVCGDIVFVTVSYTWYFNSSYCKSSRQS